MSKENVLVQGQVKEAHFNLLIDGTRMIGVGILSALYDHLVCSVRKSEAMAKYKVNISQFYRRMKVVQKKHELACMLAKFYRKSPQDPSSKSALVGGKVTEEQFLLLLKCTKMPGVQILDILKNLNGNNPDGSLAPLPQYEESKACKTKIRGAGIIAALYEHLVMGTQKQAAMDKHKVNISHFYRRMKVLQKTSDWADKLERFCPEQGEVI